MFGMMAVHEETAEYVLDDKKLDALPGDFYATRSYTDFFDRFRFGAIGRTASRSSRIWLSRLRMIRCMFPNPGSASTAATMRMATRS